MKKIAMSILAAGMAALMLASCGGDGATTTASGKNSQTPGRTTETPKTTPAATTGTTSKTPETSKPTETAKPGTTTQPSGTTTKPEVTPDQPSGNENLNYTIDVDLTLVDGNAGIIFGGIDSNNFVMWQLAIGEHPDSGNLYLRPHTWVNGGGACVEEIVLNEQPGLENISVDYNVKHHMTIRVMKDGSVETAIDGVDVYTTSLVSDLLPADDPGMVGFRCDCYQNGTIPEIGIFGDLKIVAGDGSVIYEDDFTKADSTLCAAMMAGSLPVVGDQQYPGVVELVEGGLKITGKFLNLTEIG